MKTTFKLTEENAGSVLKYAEIVSATPNEFLNKLVYDFCTWTFDRDNFSGSDIEFLNTFSFKTREAAERYRVWLTDRMMESAGESFSLVIRIEEDNEGLFWIKGTQSYKGVNFKL